MYHGDEVIPFYDFLYFKMHWKAENALKNKIFDEKISNFGLFCWKNANFFQYFEKVLSLHSCLKNFFWKLKDIWYPYGAPKCQKFAGKGQNKTIRQSITERFKTTTILWVLGIWSMADWLTCSAFTHRAWVRSRAQNSFFLFCCQNSWKFLHIHIFMRGTRWPLLK
jgi:hypothetical protein